MMVVHGESSSEFSLVETGHYGRKIQILSKNHEIVYFSKSVEIKFECLKLVLFGRS